MKFSMVSSLLAVGTVSLASAQTLRGAPKTKLSETTGSDRRVSEAGYDQKQGYSCRTSDSGMGTEGIEFTSEKLVGDNFWSLEHVCADKCSDDASCLAYEFRWNSGVCNLWRAIPTTEPDQPWITCSIKAGVISHPATAKPTESPTAQPTHQPTAPPTGSPTSTPTETPSEPPSGSPTHVPTASPTRTPTETPTSTPTTNPTYTPTESPANQPTSTPTSTPTEMPTKFPTTSPTLSPTTEPTSTPTSSPTSEPTERIETRSPTAEPTPMPTAPHRLNKNGWTAYMNSWTSSLSAEFYQPNGERAAICGVSSYHSNVYEDRRFRFKYCTPENPVTATLTATTGYSDFDDHFYVDCGGDSFISSITSFFNRSKGDRAFKYECHKFEGYSAEMCSWTDWANTFDRAFDFECGDQSVVVGMDTYHSNFREDRRFRFKCCRLNRD